MTSSYPGSAVVTASMNVPQTQNTAPVLEFRCLYTQDLRRKQKRWQDGRLKFHTFNKRIMVYDERSNFVGDTHFREDSEFAEGEELQLERSGILVEVGECVGKRDQDLTELVEKRVKEREVRAAAKIASPAPSLLRTQGTPTSNHLQPKSLNTLVTPTGHYGRALAPGNSPFEERQKLAGAQEKNEQERPAKRRKQNELALSKSGYAQNLMGTTLSLTSSRPSSTASIRYEPLKIKVSAPVRSTIDLTLDGSDDSDQRLVGRTGEVKDAAKPSRVQRKTRRSPPAKSGYASSLTGVALSLSRPESFGQTRVSKISGPRPAAMSNIRVDEDLSEEEDRFSEIISPKTPPVKVVPNPQKRPKPQNSRTPLSMSSSPPPPPRKEITPALRKDALRSRILAQDSSGIEPTPDKPMSALRIKARSGPKMMMLIGRPSSRQAAPANSSKLLRTKSLQIQKPPKPSNDIALSQATIQLNAFCQKQEERFQARLRGERRTRIMDLDNLSPSPVDSGIDSDIDHQMIDKLLSRRSGQSKDDIEASVDVGRRYNVANMMEASEEVQQEAPLGQSKRQNRPDPQPSSRPVISKSHPPEPQQNQRSPIERLRSASPVIDSNRVEMANPPLLSSSASIHDHQDLSLDSSPVNQPDSVTTLAQPIRTEVIAPEQESSMLETRKPKPLVGHVIGDIQAATEHFRAFIKSSDSQAHELAGVPPLTPEEIEARPKVTRAQLGHHELDSRQMPPKTFSELPQPLDNETVDIIGPEAGQNALVVDGTLCADGAPTKPGAAVIPSMPPPRRLLVNPATRGKSVQALAANTIDTLNPTSNVIALPPPRLSSRTATISGRNDVGRDGGRKEASDSGPWSREAFDLFGPSVHEAVGKLRDAKAAAG